MCGIVAVVEPPGRRAPAQDAAETPLEQAVDALAHRGPDGRGAWVSADGRVARIDSAAGRGLVWRMGADTCARRLTGGEVAHARGSRVSVHLGDYAAPRVAVTLTEDEQAAWADWMASI